MKSNKICYLAKMIICIRFDNNDKNNNDKNPSNERGKRKKYRII